MPAPSSRISMVTKSPSCCADRRTWPCRGLLQASRSDGTSMPWSIALRTRCTSGSAKASTRLRSSSVSAPTSSRSTSFCSWRATSRATLGKRENTLPTGCMRVRMTAVCRRAVAMSRLLTARSSSSSRMRARSVFSRLRDSTSSPTRLTMASSRLVSTRMVCSVSPPALATGLPAGAGLGAGCGRGGGAGEGAATVVGTPSPCSWSSSASNSSSEIRSPPDATAAPAAGGVAGFGAGAAWPCTSN